MYHGDGNLVNKIRVNPYNSTSHDGRFVPFCANLAQQASCFDVLAGPRGSEYLCST